MGKVFEPMSSQPVALRTSRWTRNQNVDKNKGQRVHLWVKDKPFYVNLKHEYIYMAIFDIKLWLLENRPRDKSSTWSCLLSSHLEYNICSFQFQFL